MADFYTFTCFEMNRDGTEYRELTVNLDNVLTVMPEKDMDANPKKGNPMKILLTDGTTLRVYHYNKFIQDMGIGDDEEGNVGNRSSYYG